MKKPGCFGVLLFFALCLSMLANMVLLGLLSARASKGFVHKPKTGSLEEVELVAGGKDKIAVVPLEGIIAYAVKGPGGNSMVEEFKDALDQALADDSVAAIVISVDSPGGEITASDVLYNAVRMAREEKPVVVFMNSIGASGAYYAACGANYIMCNPTTFTGSIGVIISTLNYQNLFGKIGLQSLVFKSGKFKDMLNGAREISPEESAYVQGLVMQSYERFLGIVCQNRKLDTEQLRNGVADGRIMSGIDAKEAGLVDELGYIEDAYSKAMELGKVENATVVRYEPRFNFSRFFRLFGESKANGVRLQLLPEKLGIEPGRLYLLPITYFY
jgi:protease-4